MVQRITRDLENLGHTEMTLKGDGEPALTAIMVAVKDQRAHKTLLEHPPAHDPQSNGVAEKGVQDATGVVRTLKLALEQRIGVKIEDSDKIVEWMLEHSGWILSNCVVGRGGRVSAQRITGRAATKPLIEFGEQIMLKPKRSVRMREHKRATLASRWISATWVGFHDRTGEHIGILGDDYSGMVALKARTKKGASRQVEY